MDQLRRSLGLACLTLLLSGCGTAPRPAWSDSFDSPDALADAVLEGLAAGDTSRLARLALSERELRETVWPELPAARPEVGMPWEYFWRDHAQRNAGHLRSIVSQHGGRGYELAAVSFDGRDTYGAITIHKETALDLHTAAGPLRVRLFGSMAEMHGRWKLYSYVVD